MIGRGVARLLGISQRVGAVSTKEIESVSIDQVSVAEKPVAKKKEVPELTKRVFGVATKRATPAGKLAAAASSMKSRIESLESRALQSRKSASEQMKLGNKAAAMRELKRCKALEKQAISTQNVMDAIETQSDMLEQTALQKEVADALGATAKSIKKEKGLISKAEDAVDAAAEMRDLHEDLVSVMAGLGDTLTNEFDEDELLSELNDMVNTNDTDDVGSGVSASGSSPNTSQVHQTNQHIEEQAAYDQYDKLEIVRQMPAAPKGKLAIERQGLLGAP